MSGIAGENISWWGTFEIPLGHWTRWRIGPLKLAIQHLESEWRIAQELIGNTADTRVEKETFEEWEDLLSYANVSRFGVSSSSPVGNIGPALADRSVVSTPDRPFYIPAHESLRVYVGSAAWVQVFTGEETIQLTEFPIHQPSDTWFGADTRQGEVCYASRTFCRLRLDELARRPHRVTTAVTIRNRADTPLYLEQMKLPVTYLSVFATDDAMLWTEDVVFERVDDDDDGPMRILPGPPKDAPKAKRLAPPRQRHSGNVMIRAFSALFS